MKTFFRMNVRGIVAHLEYPRLFKALRKALFFAWNALLLQ